MGVVQSGRAFSERTARATAFSSAVATVRLILTMRFGHCHGEAIGMVCTSGAIALRACAISLFHHVRYVRSGGVCGPGGTRVATLAVCTAYVEVPW